MSEYREQNFDNILFPTGSSSDKPADFSAERKTAVTAEVECPQCDRGDFCSKHSPGRSIKSRRK